MHESTICSSPPPTCIAHPGAIQLHNYWAVFDSPSELSRFYAMRHTILVITISCKYRPRCHVAVHFADNYDSLQYVCMYIFSGTSTRARTRAHRPAAPRQSWLIVCLCLPRPLWTTCDLGRAIVAVSEAFGRVWLAAACACSCLDQPCMSRRVVFVAALQLHWQRGTEVNRGSRCDRVILKLIIHETLCAVCCGHYRY